MQLEWLSNEVRTLCPVCRKDGPKRAVLSVDHVLPEHPRITLLRCQDCGAAFLDDLTPPDYAGGLPAMLDYYVEQGAGIDLIVEPLLRVPKDSVRRMLEVGCAFGFALDFARHANGWEVLGVDPSPLAAAGALALDLPVRQAYLDASIDLGPEPFDVVFCSEILEHVADPHALLAAIRARLPAEGLLVLTTPNLSIVNEQAGKGALGRALSPGLHLILYDRAALSTLLAAAGFSEVLVEETPETLRAFAAFSPASLARVQPYDPSTGRPILRDYFQFRAESAPRASSVACGFAYRHFKECVNAGLYEEAEASRTRLTRIYREGYGINLEEPVSIPPPGGARVPFNLAGACFFSAILELNRHGRPAIAAKYFAAAIKAGEAMQRGQVIFGFHDGETEGLILESRKHLPIALAAADPGGSLITLEALAELTDNGAFPLALLIDTRAQTFVRLVNAGHQDAAARLAPRIAEEIDFLSLEARGGESPASLDAPFCLGMLWLQQARYLEAASIFARVFRAARRRVSPERAELLWSSRVHEARCLSLAGEHGAARTALEEMASIARQPGMPPVPPQLVEAAREIVSQSDAAAATSLEFTGPPPTPRLLIAERFIAPCARLSGVDLPLDVIAREPIGRLRIVLIWDPGTTHSHRVSTITPGHLRVDDSLRLSFAPFANEEGAIFTIGAWLLPGDDGAKVDAGLDTIRAAASDRTAIVLACRSDDHANRDASLLFDESSILAFRVGRPAPKELRTAHAIEVYWCDSYGIYISGWAHAWEKPTHAIRLESAGRAARTDALDERADLLPHYPEHDHVRNSGFALYLECPAGHSFTLVLETDRGDAAIPLQLPDGPIPAWMPDGIGDELSPGLRRFAELVNAQDGVILQIGSRTAPGASASPPRRLFKRRVIGLDIHPGHNVDVVGDAHNLSRFVRAQSIGAILSLSVLEHLEAPWLLADEINRVLKPGGLVYHQAPFAWPAHAQPNDFWRMSSEGLRVLFGPRYGFEVLEARDFGPAAIIPGPGWRKDFMGMPTVPSYASSEIVSRKVATIEGRSSKPLSETAPTEDRSRKYPVAGLRLPERGDRQ